MVLANSNWLLHVEDNTILAAILKDDRDSQYFQLYASAPAPAAKLLACHAQLLRDVCRAAAAAMCNTLAG